jgi:neutral ceramidase
MQGARNQGMINSPFRYKAGAASVCITPAEPLWLAGYAVRTAPARGKISELFVSALALEDETGQRFVIVSAEIIAINAEISERVVDIVRARHGLERAQFLLAATHTHYAPEFRSDKQVFFHIPDEYGAKLPTMAEKLVSAISHAIDQALARLQPVRLFVRKTAVGFAHNRRRRGVKAGTPSTDDTLDRDVPVLDCVDASGTRKAIVFGYACHCTTIPPEDLRYCGDWAGFAKEQLQQVNGGATALFIPGPGADQDPEPRGSLEFSRQYGHELADSVQQALDGPGVEIAGPIRIGWENVQLSLQPITRDAIAEMLISDDAPQQVKAKFLIDQLERGEELITSYSAPIQVVHFGSELLLVALSGEPVIDWAHKIKQGAGNWERGVGNPDSYSPLVWVAGYCNDIFDYVPTRRIQAEGGYEGGRANLWNWIPTPFTEDVEDRITAAVYRLIRQVSE